LRRTLCLYSADWRKPGNVATALGHGPTSPCADRRGCPCQPATGNMQWVLKAWFLIHMHELYCEELSPCFADWSHRLAVTRDPIQGGLLVAVLVFDRSPLVIVHRVGHYTVDGPRSQTITVGHQGLAGSGWEISHPQSACMSRAVLIVGGYDSLTMKCRLPMLECPLIQSLL